VDHRAASLTFLTLPGFGPVFFLGFSAGWFSRAALRASRAVKNATQAGQYGDGESAERRKLLPQCSQILDWTTVKLKLGVAIATMNDPFPEAKPLKFRAKPGRDHSHFLFQRDCGNHQINALLKC